MRYLNENFLILWGTLMININLIWDLYQWWDLIDAKEVSMISVSSFIIFLYSIGILTLVIVSIWQINAKKRWVNLLAFVKGLNLKRILSSILYFVHYFGIWMLVSILILMTPDIKLSFLLWIFLAVIQLVAIGIHIFKIYQTWIHYVLVLIREVQILFVVLFLLVNHFIDQSTDAKWLKQLRLFVYIFQGFLLVFTTINLLNFLYQFILLIWALIRKAWPKTAPKKGEYVMWWDGTSICVTQVTSADLIKRIVDSQKK